MPTAQTIYYGHICANSISIVLLYFKFGLSNQSLLFNFQAYRIALLLDLEYAINIIFPGALVYLEGFYCIHFVIVAQFYLLYSLMYSKIYWSILRLVSRTPHYFTMVSGSPQGFICRLLLQIGQAIYPKTTLPRKYCRYKSMLPSAYVMAR